MENVARVVVTGIGVVSSAGFSRQAFWEALVTGSSGIRRIEGFDTSCFRHRYGAEVRDFDVRNFIGRKNVRYLDRITRMGLAAAALSLEDAGIETSALNEKRSGIVMGTMHSGWGSVAEFECSMENNRGRRVSPALFPNTVLNSAASQIAIEFHLRGLCTTLNTGFASGADAIGYGYEYIRNRRADLVLAGGAEELNKWIYGSFDLEEPPGDCRNGHCDNCRPFDADRRGFTIGEGACFLVLENLAEAGRRKAPIYGEIKGYVTNYAGNVHEADSIGDTVAEVIENAVSRAGVDAEDIGFICAEGNGTHASDMAESQAIQTLFRKNSKKPAVSSIKPVIGHTIGASGAFNAATCCLAIQGQAIPPTLNLVTPDPLFPLDHVMNSPRTCKIKNTLCNSFSPGGNHAALVIGHS